MNHAGGRKKTLKTFVVNSIKRESMRSIQLKKKMRNEGGRKRSHNEGSVPVAGNCNSVTCLNNLLVLQKMDKDIARNYMQQTSRTDARIRLGGLYAV